METARQREFPPFRLDPDSEKLWRGTEQVPLRPKSFAVLRYLVEHADRLVSREELEQAVWGQTRVSEAVLRGCLREIRQALGDSADSPQFIETVPRRGWRFIALRNPATQPVSGSTFQGSRATPPPTLRIEDQEKELLSPPQLFEDAQPLLEEVSDTQRAESGLGQSPVETQPSEIIPPHRPTGKKSWWKVAAVVGLLISGGIIARLSPSLSPLITQHSVLVTQEALPLPDKPSITVLPFANLSGDPEQEYFSDGITADLTNDLSQIPDLFVIARNSAFAYKGKSVNVQQISRELGVRYVIEGSVSKAGDRLRIRVELVDATTGFQLWSERYEQEVKDLFVIQDEIVRQIMTTLKLQPPLLEKGIYLRKRTANLEAYDITLRGIQVSMRRTKEANAQARQMFEKAIALDPQYAWAYTAVGFTYLNDYVWEWNREPQVLQQMFTFANQALALDTSLSRAHSLLSWFYVWKNQFEQALIENEQAIALDPNDADSHARQAEVLNNLGRAEEAQQAVQHAMRLNPHYPTWYLVESAWAYRQLLQTTEALQVLETLRQRDPTFPSLYSPVVTCYLIQWSFQLSSDSRSLEQAFAAAQHGVSIDPVKAWNHRTLGVVYMWQKQYEQAIAEQEQAVALDPTHGLSYVFLAEALARSGKSEEAIRFVKQALHLDPTPSAELYLNTLGVVHYLLGQTDEAIALFKTHLLRFPDSIWSHLHLAAAYAALGRDEEAQAEAMEVLRLSPNFSLELYRQRVPFKDPRGLGAPYYRLAQGGAEVKSLESRPVGTSQDKSEAGPG